MIVILACGDRNWPSPSAVAKYLRAQEFDVLIHGDARGADRLAGAIAERMNRSVEVFPALWDAEGRAAGPIRNARMLNRLLEWQDRGDEVRVVAFHNDLDSSKGTAHMVKIAKRAGVRVTLVKMKPR